MYVLTAIITAESLGINTASLTAIMSVLTLGVTLAAEDILGNVAGGLVILSSHPFGIGDTIEAGGTVGTVREISLNHTKLETADGQIVLQPNRQLSSSKIINYTTLGRRRVVRTVTASYDAPTDTVKAACMDAVRTVPGVLSDPAPEVYLTSYGASSIEYAVRCWTSVEDYWNAYYTLNEALRPAPGDIICLLVPTFYAVDLMVTEKAVAKPEVDPIALGVLQTAVAGVVMLGLSLLLETPSLPGSPRVWAAALFLGVFCSGICFVIQSVEQQFTTASHASLIFTLEPVFSAVFAYFLLSERLTVRGYFGAALMLVSLLIMELDVPALLKKDEKAP